MDGPSVSLIVPTFERPKSLHLVLTSIECQTRISDDDLEVIVTDDGSQDGTREVVEQFQRNSRFRVVFTTHPHDGFQLARSRNDGVRASSAPYLVFLDGDCIAPHDHIHQHLARRQPRTVMAGFCYFLDQAASAQINENVIKARAFDELPTASQRRRLTRMDQKARLYALIRHPWRPKLYGGAFGIWRQDYELINGFNEDFVGWGCEDDEFCIRLRRAGVRVRSILRWTRTYHLWHPQVSSCPQNWKHGSNVQKLDLEKQRTTYRCEHGLVSPH
jgi:glycosyltransferase involved in cell wall biosynthesis